jgi:hypothetical protein
MTEKEAPRNRQVAYRAGAEIARERIRRESPSDAAALDAVEAADIVVVPGVYDHVEQVLETLGMPFTLVGERNLARTSLRPEQLLVINCPGQIGRRGVDKVRSFVEEGGSLFSTDWALRHVIEAAFPNTVAFNERPTQDAVVRVEVLSSDNQFLQGVMDGRDDPQWWLEGSSYPIRVIDPERVEVLIQSKELGEAWGETPVAVLFHHGEGEVFHMISHYYLQRTECRTARHRQSAAAYAAEKDVVLSERLRTATAGMSLGEVESAATSARFMANVVAAKKRGTASRSRTGKKD